MTICARDFISLLTATSARTYRRSIIEPRRARVAYGDHASTEGDVR